MAKVISINISEKKGEIKIPVTEGVFVQDHGLEGDAHSGKWHRQISLLAQESIDKMKALGIDDLNSGSFAENLTTQGIELHTLPIGTVLQVGQTIQKVTQIGKHCHQHCAIYHKVGQCIMPTEGIFTEVLKGGIVKPGDDVIVLEEASLANAL